MTSCSVQNYKQTDRSLTMNLLMKNEIKMGENEPAFWLTVMVLSKWNPPPMISILEDDSDNDGKRVSGWLIARWNPELADDKSNKLSFSRRFWSLYASLIKHELSEISKV